MRYVRLSEAEKALHPSILYTGSVRGMKKQGYWGKNDLCVRCGQVHLQPLRHHRLDVEALTVKIKL